MAKIAILADNNSIIASKAIPNTFSTFVQRVTGGATNAEIATNFLTEITPVVRTHYYKKRIGQLQVTPQQEIIQSEVDTGTAISAEWGET